MLSVLRISSGQRSAAYLVFFVTHHSSIVLNAHTLFFNVWAEESLSFSLLNSSGTTVNVNCWETSPLIALLHNSKDSPFCLGFSFQDFVTILTSFVTDFSTGFLVTDWQSSHSGHQLTIIRQKFFLSSFDKGLWGINLIKTSGSESQGQEEAACTHVFRPMRPLQWVIYTYDRSIFLKCCSSAAITTIV